MGPIISRKSTYPTNDPMSQHFQRRAVNPASAVSNGATHTAQIIRSSAASNTPLATDSTQQTVQDLKDIAVDIASTATGREGDMVEDLKGNATDTASAATKRAVDKAQEISTSNASNTLLGSDLQNCSS